MKALGLAAASTDTVSTDRSTVREDRGRLAQANAVAGEQAEVTAYRGGRVRIRVTTSHAMATPVGRVSRTNLTEASQSGGLDGVPERCGTDADRRRGRVGAIDASFHSLRKVPEGGTTG